MTGTVAAGHPAAAEAGAHIMRCGGNAADAAAATLLALCVADPANVSLFGRCHFLIRTPQGTVSAIDGATATPVATPSQAPGEGIRTGYAQVPFPGLPQAVHRFHAQFGRMSFDQVVAPAAELARTGVWIGPSLSKYWALYKQELHQNIHARKAYGTPVGRFRFPALGAVLERFGTGGAEEVLTPQLVSAMQASGAHWTIEDLTAHPARDGEIVTTEYRGWRVHSIGGQGWGHTLLQMLALWERSKQHDPATLARIFIRAFDDRPQEMGTLVPKPDGIALAALISAAFTDPARLTDPAAQARILTESPSLPDQDTTHFSVIDHEGMAVSTTASIGVHFGTRVGDPLTGILLPTSYRMAHSPEPNVRDVTEMCPALLEGPHGELIAIGAAGSERIPCAIVQVLIRMIDEKMPLAEAIAAPRLNIKAGLLRLHPGYPTHHVESARLPYIIKQADDPMHLGVVHAVMRTADRRIEGAADPAYDGAARD